MDKGFSEEESNKLLKERQTTFTLKKCIDKYGLNKGTNIYNNRQKKWVKKMFNENTCMSTGRSNISDEFIQNLILSINNKIITDNFLYGKDEKFIYDKDDKRGKRYDLCYNNKIIEFNGDFWHANPRQYKKDDIHRIKKIECLEIWKQDDKKINLAIKYNYKILVIWESDYKKDKNFIIKKCKNFLLYENND